MTGPSRTPGARVCPLDVLIHQDSAELLAGLQTGRPCPPLASCLWARSVENTLETVLMVLRCAVLLGQVPQEAVLALALAAVV